RVAVSTDEEAKGVPVATEDALDDQLIAVLLGRKRGRLRRFHDWRVMPTPHGEQCGSAGVRIQDGCHVLRTKEGAHGHTKTAPFRARFFANGQAPSTPECTPTTAPDRRAVLIQARGRPANGAFYGRRHSGDRRSGNRVLNRLEDGLHDAA